MSNNVKWSELTTDVLQLILERLSIINYLRARTVCKNWYVVSKQISLVQDKFPWMIIFPRKRPNTGSCQLFNPQEDKFYRLSNLGNDFCTSRCIATSGGWLLMLDLRSNMYVLNVFTRERIDLPPFESHQGRLQIKRRQGNKFEFIINQSFVTAEDALKRTKSVLWVDEKTKGYIVVWSIGFSYIMYTKTGFDFWSEIPTREGPNETLYGCQDIVYKDNKLYVCSRLNQIRILNFSQELPIALLDNVDQHPFTNDILWRVKIGVTVSGDVLLTRTRLDQIFKILKQNSEGTRLEVESLGEESWIMDLGVTVPAVNGTKPNSIYYSRDKCVYCGDVSTQVLEMVLNVYTNRNFGYARWFIPCLRQLYVS